MSIRAENALVATDSSEGLVSIRVGAQTFGVPVLSVRDVISETPVSRVPLSPPEVAGSLNLRGRIVTAVDMRRRLGMTARPSGERSMNVIVEERGELYALIVDDVGDVLWLEPAGREPGPVTLSAEWRVLCNGLYRLEGELLLVLNIPEVLTLSGASSIAA